MAEQQHDEGHDEGDGDGLGERKVPQRGEHPGGRGEMDQRAQRGQTQDAGRHGEARAEEMHGGREKDGLEPEAREQQHAERHGVAEDLGDGVGHRDQHAEGEHEADAEKGTVRDHGATLGPPGAGRNDGLAAARRPCINICHRSRLW